MGANRQVICNIIILTIMNLISLVYYFVVINRSQDSLQLLLQQLDRINFVFLLKSILIIEMNKRNQEEPNNPPQTGTVWKTFKGFFCPCLLPVSRSPIRTNNPIFQPLEQTRQSQRGSGPYDKKNTPENVWPSKKEAETKRKKNGDGQYELKRESLLDKTLTKKELSQILPRQATTNRRSLGNSGWDYSVNSLTEKELFSLGINDRHLLVKVSPIRLAPNPAALKKQLSQTSKQRRQDQFGNTDIDRSWVQRYALFQRFDQGIKLDEKSWRLTPPGPVCEWIAGKCGQAKLIVDAFAGVGGTSIRLASGGHKRKIIANDWSSKRLDCLLNNAKVYEVDKCIELSEDNFLKLQRHGVEVVFAQPPLADLEGSTHGSLSIVDFEPSLDKIIYKALELSNNFLLLLPAATSVDVLCSCINKCATELGKMKDSCSIKIQKIYWQGQLRYILVMMGRVVQEEVKLSHQLDYIYSRLQGGQKSAFKQKKVIKLLREQFGMIFLFNLVKQAQKKLKQRKLHSQLKPLDILLQLIRQRSLIPKQKLEKLINEQDQTEKKRESQFTNAIIARENTMEPMMEEEKVNEDLAYFRQSEQTQSEVSHYSYLSSLEKPLISSRQPRIFAQSFGSIIIKRTLNGSREKRSISPQSPLNSPKTPKRAKNRVSQVVVGKRIMQPKSSKQS